VTRWGEPAAAVRVFLSAAQHELPCAEPRDAATTDATGAFSLRLPADGESLCIETELGPTLGYERRAGVDPAASLSLHCEESAPLRIGGLCWLGRDTAPVVLGFVEENAFIPMVAFADSEFVPYEAKWMKLEGPLRNAFEAGSESIPIESDEVYPDQYTSGDARMAHVKSPAREGTFFALGRAQPFPAERPSGALESAFLGRMEEPKTWRVGWVTDLDQNGRKELWVDHRFMYGEIGRIVYEQSASDSDEQWTELASECWGCD
jgi:hypothetical protein